MMDRNWFLGGRGGWSFETLHSPKFCPRRSWKTARRLLRHWCRWICSGADWLFFSCCKSESQAWPYCLVTDENGLWQVSWINIRASGTTAIYVNRCWSLPFLSVLEHDCGPDHRESVFLCPWPQSWKRFCLHLPWRHHPPLDVSWLYGRERIRKCQYPLYFIFLSVRCCTCTLLVCSVVCLCWDVALARSSSVSAVWCSCGWSPWSPFGLSADPLLALCVCVCWLMWLVTCVQSTGMFGGGGGVTGMGHKSSLSQWCQLLCRLFLLFFCFF